jgi:hypothetical protein
METVHSLEKYKNHLQFLGYSLQELDDNTLVCRHTRRDSMRLIKLANNIGVLATINYRLPQKHDDDLEKLLLYINDLNRCFVFVKTYVNRGSDDNLYIAIESVLEGEYDQKNFSIFMDNIADDMLKFINNQQTKNMFNEKNSEEFICLTGCDDKDSNENNIYTLFDQKQIALLRFLYASKVLPEELENILKILSTIEIQILWSRYGLDSGSIRNLDEVAKKFGISGERVRQIESKALRKMHNPRYNSWIKKYIS